MINPRVPNIPGAAGRLGVDQNGLNIDPSLSGRVSTAPFRLSNQAVANLGLSGDLGLMLDSRFNRLAIGSLSTGSLAATLGLQAGDQILAVNRAWVVTPAGLRAQLNAAIASDGRAWVYVNRNGTPQWVNLDLASAARSRLGVNIQDQSGVVTVANIYPGSAAAAAGLRPGDEILVINGVNVSSNAQLREQLRAAAKADGKLALDIRRDGAEQTLQAQLAARTDASGSARTTVGFRGARQLRQEIGDLRAMVTELSNQEGNISKERLADLQKAVDELYRRLDAAGGPQN